MHMQVHADSETCPRSSAPASSLQGTLEHLTGCATLAVRRGCFTNQRHWCQATTTWRATVNGRVRRAPEGLRGIRAIDLSRRGPGLLGLDHKQFPVRHLCETASVHSTSRAPAGWRACVAGGAEEPRLARRVRSSKRRHHDAYAAPRRRRARAIRAAVPSSARAAVPDRANAALPELVLRGRGSPSRFGRQSDVWIAHTGGVMPAEGGVTGRDFRKRDEEKFARHSG